VAALKTKPKFYKMMSMKKFTTALLACILVVNAGAQTTIINDPNAELRTLSGSFTSIKVSGGIDIVLTQGSEEVVAVSASKDAYRDAIKTEVKDGVLSIGYRSDDNYKLKIEFKSKSMRAYVSFKALEKITGSGACDIQVNGVINVPNLSIVLSGACDFKGEVKLSELKVDVSGASDARLSGTVTDATISASGASDIKGFDLATDNCSIKASGASDINITVNKELNVHASGASDVRYKGNCVIKEMQSSGASGVGKRG
jgi:Putative auto-transporter adhesin, head GIN domain